MTRKHNSVDQTWVLQCKASATSNVCVGHQHTRRAGTTSLGGHYKIIARGGKLIRSHDGSSQISCRSCGGNGTQDCKSNRSGSPHNRSSHVGRHGRQSMSAPIGTEERTDPARKMKTDTRGQSISSSVHRKTQLDWAILIRNVRKRDRYQEFK